MPAMRFGDWPRAVGVFEGGVGFSEKLQVCLQTSCRSVAGEMWAFATRMQMPADEV